MAGSHRLRVVTDTNETIRETNENNNEIVRMFKVRALPLSTPPSTPQAPETPDEKETVKNRVTPIDINDPRERGSRGNIMLYYFIGLGAFIVVAVASFE